MSVIEINNLIKAKVNQKHIKSIVNKILTILGKKINVSIVLVNKRTIKKLNKKYRKKNKITDVLSFGGLEFEKEKIIKGEIVICWSVIKKQAKFYKHSINEEVKRILIHSILHLLGYTHKRKSERERMQKKEEFLFDKLKYV